MSEITKYNLTNKTTGEKIEARPVNFGDNFVTLETTNGVRHDFQNLDNSGVLTNSAWTAEEIKVEKKEKTSK